MTLSASLCRPQFEQVTKRVVICDAELRAGIVRDVRTAAWRAVSCAWSFSSRATSSARSKSDIASGDSPASGLARNCT
jgi:hypothetical protein